jgi:inhibitor of cysteine peptidase
LHECTILTKNYSGLKKRKLISSCDEYTAVKETAHMNHFRVIISLGIICIITVASSGCVGSEKDYVGKLFFPPTLPTPSGTAVPVNHLVVTEEQNGATVNVNMGALITVKLPENPTTGYSWNLTTTPGLQIINDTYKPTYTTGKMVGSGGTHIWDISAAATGEQKIKGVYMRSWEPISGNETDFSMTVVVV